MPLEVVSLDVCSDELQVDTLVHHIGNILIFFLIASIKWQVRSEKHVGSLFVEVIKRHLEATFKHLQVDTGIVCDGALPVEVFISGLRHLQVIVASVARKSIKIVNGLRAVVAVIAVFAGQTD